VSLVIPQAGAYLLACLLGLAFYKVLNLRSVVSESCGSDGACWAFWALGDFGEPVRGGAVPVDRALDRQADGALPS
jgi:hypothetical protein